MNDWDQDPKLAKVPPGMPTAPVQQRQPSSEANCEGAIFRIVDACGLTVATVARGDAAFIVEAVNSHAALQARVNELEAEADRNYNAAVELGRRAERAESRVEGLTKALEDERIACADIATRFNDCGGDFIAQKIRDRALSMPLEQEKSHG